MLFRKATLYQVPWDSSYKDVIAPQSTINSAQKIELLNQFSSYPLASTSFGTHMYRNNNWMTISIEVRVEYRVIKDYNYLLLEGDLSSQQQFYFVDSIEALNTSSCRLNCTYDVWFNNINEILTNGNVTQNIVKGHSHRFNNLKFIPQFKTSLPSSYFMTYAGHYLAQPRPLWLQLTFPISNSTKIQSFSALPETPLFNVGIGSSCYRNGFGIIYVLVGGVNQLGDLEDVKLLDSYDKSVTVISGNVSSVYQHLPEKVVKPHLPEILEIDNNIMSCTLTTTTMFDEHITINDHEEWCIDRRYVPFTEIYGVNNTKYRAIVGVANEKGTELYIESDESTINVDDEIDYGWNIPHRTKNKPYGYKYEDYVYYTRPILGNVNKDNQLEYEPAFYSYPFKWLKAMVGNSYDLTFDIDSEAEIKIKATPFFLTPAYNIVYGGRELNNRPIVVSNQSNILFTTDASATFLNNSGAQLEQARENAKMNHQLASASAALSALSIGLTVATGGITAPLLVAAGGSALTAAKANRQYQQEIGNIEAQLVDINNKSDIPNGGYGNDLINENTVEFKMVSCIDSDKVNSMKEIVFKYGYNNIVSKPINYSRNNFSYTATEDYNSSSLMLSNDEKIIIKSIFDNGVFINYVDTNLKLHNPKFLKNSNDVFNFEPEYVTEEE